MEWIRSLDVGLIVFAVLGLGFIYLMIAALKRQRQRRIGSDDTEDTPKLDEAKPKDKLGKAAARKAAKAEKVAARRKAAADKRAAAKAKAAPDSDIPEEAPDDLSVAELPTDQEEERMQQGLAKTRGGFISKLGKLFKGKQIGENLLDEIEEVLFTADIGVQTANQLIDGLRKKLNKSELKDPEAIWSHLRSCCETMVSSVTADPLTYRSKNGMPFVLLVIGVNGVGKTTTIGKLASRMKAQGLKVMLIAGDTFRAAAVDQLKIWGDRTETPVVTGNDGADPTSVMVDGLKQAKAEGYDLVIADTAGRLHTKADLMDELEKIGRGISKQVDGAPHETFLVLDSTTGQNAITQAKLFKEAMDITGIVLTKLDGTAKGGVLLGICNELKVPIRYVGIGEQVEDLRVFSSEAFTNALFEKRPD
jgi:fused signal recognition particle receptor